MRRFITLIFLLVIIQVNTQAQSCLPEGITFTSQEQIDNFQMNYPNCTEIEGDVAINDWENDITNLHGLNVLTQINGDLKIGFIFSLNDLTGLENLVSVGGDLLIGYQDNYILMETFLYSLSGLDNLTSVGGELSILFNLNLADLSGLHNLASVGGDLFISGCYALTSLNGLEQLNSIGSDLRIIYNDTLQSLNGLENIDANSIANLDIYGNPYLVDCDILSICDYLASPNGIVEIHDNATGCNNQQEVEAACGVGLDESSVVSHQSSVSIYPNPSSNVITIELLSNNSVKSTFLTIYNLSGQALSSHQLLDKKTVVDVSALPKGIFLVKVKDDRTVEVGKFVKQ